MRISLSLYSRARWTWFFGLAGGFLTALAALAWVGVIPNVVFWVLLNLVFVASAIPVAGEIVNDVVSGTARGSSLEHERLEGSLEQAKTLLFLGNPIGWVCTLVLLIFGLLILGVFLFADWPVRKEDEDDEGDEEWGHVCIPPKDISLPPPAA